MALAVDQSSQAMDTSRTQLSLVSVSVAGQVNHFRSAHFSLQMVRSNQLLADTQSDTNPSQILPTAFLQMLPTADPPRMLPCKVVFYHP